MTALDPVRVARLLEAATQWPDAGAVRESVDGRRQLRDMAPELASEWLRLRAELDELAAVLRSMSVSAEADAEAARERTQNAYWDGVAESYGHAANEVLQITARPS